MKVYNPEDMNAAFAEAFNSGDIENLVSLYEPSAVLVPKLDLVVKGLEDIRTSLRELLALKGVMRSENQYALVHGDIALLRAKVHLVGTTPDGQQVVINNHTAEVIRLQPDGSWLYIVDHPYGADPLDAPAARYRHANLTTACSGRAKSLNLIFHFFGAPLMLSVSSLSL